MSLWCIGVAHRWLIRKEQDGEYLVKNVCITEFVDKEFVDREFVDKEFVDKEFVDKEFVDMEFFDEKFVIKELVVKDFDVKEFVDKEFVDKHLLMSLWGMRMAHEKEARGIVVGDQRRLDGSGTSCG